MTKPVGQLIAIRIQQSNKAALSARRSACDLMRRARCANRHRLMAALHRFLLAVMYRALEGPTDIDQAKALFRDGLPDEKIAAYLEKWRDRFWLFDDKFPFGQNPNVPQGEIEPWTKLTAEFNASSNKVLFDHTDTKSPGSKGPNECARWLLAGMNFSISGGRGYYPSPSPNAIVCIPLGRRLAETLIYNLIPYSNREAMSADAAQWESATCFWNWSSGVRSGMGLDLGQIVLGYAPLAGDAFVDQ